jgi:hypothetical protein
VIASRKRRRGDETTAPEPSLASNVAQRTTIEPQPLHHECAQLETTGQDKIDTSVAEEPFDAFTHPAIVENRSDTLEYEMRRMWDAWAEQMSWTRSLVEVEQSCGISKTVIANVYKSDLYPRREALLKVLSECVTPGQRTTCRVGSDLSRCSSLQATPQATILLAHISTAAALMKDK